MGKALESLREYLLALPLGPIEDATKCEVLLADAWLELDTDYGGLSGRKLIGRMEDVKWNPPLLSFTIERHGATKYGSSRAELQDWDVDVDEGTASFGSTRYRQLYKKSPSLKTKPLAEEIRNLIIEFQDSEKLKWSEDKTAVKIVISRIIPDDTAKQTVAGRRKRFRRDLTELLQKHGWAEVRPNYYTLLDKS